MDDEDYSDKFENDYTI